MKGIILAGGSGTRLRPITKSVNKQLLPIFDKPMIYYPLSTLMTAKIKEVLIITNPENIDQFKTLIGDGTELGMKINYAVQNKPRGIAEAFKIGKKFIGKKSVCLILGDNIFHGQGFGDILLKARKQKKGGLIFAYPVLNPEQFGVVKFDNDNNVISIHEKPKKPISNYAITGLYFYDNNVVEYFNQIKPSKRNEYEITSINECYLLNNKLSVFPLGRGMTWFDCGSQNAIIEASQYVHTIENRQGLKIGCIEEIAWRNKWISDKKMKEHVKKNKSSDYGKYLSKIIK